MTIRAFCYLFDPCLEARVWLRNCKDMHSAWEACTRVDWLYWTIGRMDLQNFRIINDLCQVKGLSYRIDVSLGKATYDVEISNLIKAKVKNPFRKVEYEG